MNYWIRFKKHKMAMGGLVLTLLLILIAIFAGLVAPYDPYEQDLFNSYAAPSEEHLLGLDSLGRDVLSRLIYASRISLSVGIMAALVSTVIGIVAGSLAGYAGGKVDALLSRIADGFLSFPSIVLIMTMVYVVGPNIRNVILILGILGWPQIFRLVRSQFMYLREMEFVKAAKAVGVSPFRLVRKHLFPNAVAPVIVAATFKAVEAILMESAISFLGFGVQPPIATWGNMLTDAQSLNVLATKPWIWVPPGIMVSIAILSINFVGDGLRDAFDPKSQIFGKELK